MTRILLMRHAETDRPTVFHGVESDAPLSEYGHLQAATIAPWLAAIKPDAIVSSAMRRAIDTARPIAEACGLTPEVDPLWHERRVAELSGMPIAAESGIWPDTLARWKAGELTYAPEGAESFADMQARLLPTWNRWADRFDGKTGIVVAHGIVVRVLLLSLLPGYTIADWDGLGKIGNVSVSDLIRTKSGAWQAERIGEVPEAVARLSRGGIGMNA